MANYVMKPMIHQRKRLLLCLRFPHILSVLRRCLHLHENISNFTSTEPSFSSTSFTSFKNSKIAQSPLSIASRKSFCFHRLLISIFFVYNGHPLSHQIMKQEPVTHENCTSMHNLRPTTANDTRRRSKACTPTSKGRQSQLL